jgi:tetratricopeptide (TPR) repeat protein
MVNSALLMGALSASAGVGAAPFVPTTDSEVLERLPFTANDPIARELGAMRRQLIRQPDDLPLAVSLAQRYLELGRITGDPRYAGYAQAALAPWWNLKHPPEEVLLLRATLRQRVHQFDAALTDLAAVVDANPHNPQAHLTRATVLQVQGAYDAAREECRALQGQTQELIWVACLTSVNGATGELQASYGQLRAALDRPRYVQAGVRSWVLTSLAEMAARGGMAQQAQDDFRAALEIDPSDNYLLGAYADFLLDQDRPEEVVALLRDKTRADPMLLRYALALRAQHSPELAIQVDQLRDRFEASHLRGDRVHLREEARFALDLLSAPQAALKLAQEDWQIQKEPADARILLEAALAAHDDTAVDSVRNWLKRSHLQDVQLTRLLEVS